MIIKTKYDGHVKVTLSQEDGVYNIRGHDIDSGKRLFWESARDIKSANHVFDRGALLAMMA